MTQITVTRFPALFYLNVSDTLMKTKPAQTPCGLFLSAQNEQELLKIQL